MRDRFSFSGNSVPFQRQRGGGGGGGGDDIIVSDRLASENFSNPGVKN